MDQEQETERQTYLRVAEVVLASALSPLKAREIVERGIERGLFGDHVLSRTPEKSMQARLSMDILTRAARSHFMRTARGRFALRQPVGDDVKHGLGRTEAPAQKEYIAERRILKTPNEEVLCVAEAAYRNVLTFQGIDTQASDVLSKLFQQEATTYIERAQAESQNDAKQIVTYVLVQCGQRLLHFRRSYLSRAAAFLRGAKCIGFGGHVSAADSDMLSRGDRGISACARRELMEELFLPAASATSNTKAQKNSVLQPRPEASRWSTVKLFQDIPLEPLGILNDDSSEVGRRHVAVVYRSWLPNWDVAKRLQKGDSSIKSLSWIDITREQVDISEFEYWSQLCLRKFYPSNVVSRSSFKPLSTGKVSREATIVVAGRIGSGKSETAAYLSQRLKAPIFKSGELLRELMNAPPMGEIGREKFQELAFSFINTERGPEKLAARISDAIRRSDTSRCIIDGIRHLATYEYLAQLLGKRLLLAFVQTPPDIAYDLYRSRETYDELGFSYRDFLELYDAPVETEISSLGRKADMYIYNAFGIETFRRTLDQAALHLK